MSTPAVGIDFTIEVDGQKIAGRRGATLTLGTETEDVSNADNNSWQSTINTLRSWQVQSDGLWIVDNAPLAGAGSTIEVETGVDVWTPIEHVQSIDLDFSAEPIQISSFTTGRDPEHLYGIRSANVSLSGLFVNPANAPGIDALLTSRDNGENVKIRTSFAGSTIEQTYTVGDLSIEPPYDDVSSLSVDLQSDGEPTINMNASLNTGISKLIDIFATATEELGVVMQLDSGVSFSGNAILTSFGLSIPHDGAIEVSDVTLDGSGALTQA